MVKRRIENLQKKVESIQMKDQVKFFDSHDDYMEALQRNEIKKHHICLIDDIENDDELIEKGHIIIHEG